MQLFERLQRLRIGLAKAFGHLFEPRRIILRREAAGDENEEGAEATHDAMEWRSGVVEC